MDYSVSSLSYQGSIVEAIVEAKRQKKLLVVYISGDCAESGQLEESTWTNSIVADSILKYCILLHISEGSTDAANFSVILSADPQKSAPCITAVGYNGVQLWQSEGFINAETLASSLQKAWLSLHIQIKPKRLALPVSSDHQRTHGKKAGLRTVPRLWIALLSFATQVYAICYACLHHLRILLPLFSDPVK